MRPARRFPLRGFDLLTLAHFEDYTPQPESEIKPLYMKERSHE